MEHEQAINAYVCQYCKGSFDKLENLSKHVQKIHTVSSSGKENRICPLCGTQCIKIEGYRNHLRHIHGHNEEGQVVVFKSFNDFLVWKNELEKRNYCKYVMRDPPKKLPSNDKIHIYRCDSSVRSMKEKRSGVAVKESCPAVITAIESAKTKGVKIEHWNNHVGHIIPIEEDELNAAIGSLGTTEVVLTSEQRYQYEGQSSDGNLFFITESNDGSLSETFVKETPKRSSNLFQKTKAKVSDSVSKSGSQKFSYKKDPTKKSGSFNYSLASVACMKPSAKKKIITPPAVATTCSVEDSVTTTVTNSSSAVASSEVELATESISNIIDDSANINIPVAAKEKETPSNLVSPSKTISFTAKLVSPSKSTNSNIATNPTFEFINEGSLSGQVVLLNSLPGQKGNQNVLLTPDQKFISIAPAINAKNVATVSSKKGKASKKPQKNDAISQILVIPTASEKENVSSVQNILDISENSISVDSVVTTPGGSILKEEDLSSVQIFAQNPIPLDSEVKTPGPSILKRAKKSVPKSPKKRALFPAGKNTPLAGKNGVSSPKKAISAEEKLSLGLNPTLDVTVVNAANLPKSTANNVIESVKVKNSMSSEITNSIPSTNSSNTSSVSSTQDTATTNSSLVANNSALTAIKNLVPPTIQLSVLPASQNTVSSASQISVAPSAQISVVPTVQNPGSSASENSPAGKNSASSAIKNSISAAPKNSVSSTAQICVSSAAQICVSSAAQNSVASVAQNPVSSSIRPINPIFLNSFPPGQTFMSINNNLIPIGSPTAPLLPSNFSPGFVLTSPVPPSPIGRPVRPLMAYSRLASRSPYSRSPNPRLPNPRVPNPRVPNPRLPNPSLPVTSSVGSLDNKTPNTQTSIGTAARLKAPYTPTVPFLLIPSSGTPIVSSVPLSSPFVTSSVNSTLAPSIRPNKTQTTISSPFVPSSVCPVLPRPLISSSCAPVFTQLPAGAQLIPTPIIPSIPAPFLANNSLRISRPLVQNVPILANPGQCPRSILQSISFPSPLIGQPAIAPVTPRAIVSTTISNAIKVQKVQLPFSKSAATSPSVAITDTASVTTTSLSESTKVSSVVVNTEPISSAPAISIPPLATIGPHKPGSVIFESQGDMYMLEPVDDNSLTSNNTSVKSTPNKVSIVVPSANGNTKTNKSDDVRESAFEGNKTNLSSLLKEKVVDSQSVLDTKVDGRVKSLSPRKSTEIKNGVQIKSVVQEKRHLKDDDVEILKKVKYYQMEMKYLASQAECKRLKLELAKAQMKNKEIIKNNTDLISSEKSLRQNADEDALHIDVTSDKENLELKQSSSSDDVPENMAMDVDNASQEVGDKTTEDQTVCIQGVDDIESTNQSDTDSGDSNQGGDIHSESGRSNSTDNSPVDSGDSNHNEIINPGDSNHSEIIDPVDSGDSNQSEIIDFGDTNHSEVGNSVDSNHNKVCDSIDSSHSEIVESVDSNHSEIVESVDSNHSEIVQSVDSSHSEIVESVDSNHSEIVQSVDSNHGEIDSVDSNQSQIGDLPLNEQQTEGNLVNQDSNPNLEGLDCDNELNEKSNLGTQNEAHSALNEELHSINTPDIESNNFNPCNQTVSNAETKDINEPALLNISNFSENQLQKHDDEFMDFSEIEENFKDGTEDSQAVNHSENENQLDVNKLSDKEVFVQNDNEQLFQGSEFSKQTIVNEVEDSMDLDDQNSCSLSSEAVDLPCDKTQFEETLKELESQYGREGSSDIYTMIRTSVLRNLYDDMKTLCEENKKLHEKHKKCRPQEDSCIVDELHS